MKERPVTLRDVARAAGVAVSTASMALNGHPRIAAVTRQRIAATVERLGYRRNPAFAALGSKAYRHPTAAGGLPLAFVSDDPDGPVLVGDMRSAFEGAAVQATEMGYRLSAYFLGDYPSAARLADTLWARGCAGVIFGLMQSPTVLLPPEWERFALVAVGTPTAPLPVHTVRIDRGRAAREAVLRMTGMGYHRIGFLWLRHQTPPSDDDYDRYGGVMAAQAQLGVPWRDRIPPLVHDKVIDGAALRQWLRRHRPDAILSTLGGATYNALLAEGLDIPRDIAFTCLLGGWDAVARFEHPTRELGETAVEWLDQLIRHGQFGFPEAPRAQLLRSRWIDGETLPPTNAGRRAARRPGAV